MIEAMLMGGGSMGLSIKKIQRIGVGGSWNRYSSTMTYSIPEPVSDINKTFFIQNAYSSGGRFSPSASYSLNTESSILARGSTGSGSYTGGQITIIELDKGSVEHGYMFVGITGTSESVGPFTVQLETPVDPERAVILLSCCGNYDNNSPALFDVGTVTEGGFTINRRVIYGDAHIAYQVISF